MSVQTDYAVLERRARLRRRAGRAAAYLLLTFWAVMVLFPFYWMILTSLKNYGAYNSEYVPKFFHACRRRFRTTPTRLRRCRWGAICSTR